MARGGYRKNAGRRSKWRSGKTKMIRVPIELADHLLEIAHKLDQGVSIENESKTKDIDLTGVPLTIVNGKRGVALIDLLKAGYDLKPLALAKNIMKN